MRILVAPDKFAGTLTAVEAAEAIADGWRRTSPEAEVVPIPMADGGPGFVDVLHASLGGELLAGSVSGPLAEPVPATFLLVEDVAYIESAQACGLALMPLGPDGRTPEPGAVNRASTYGVGQLIGSAVQSGARRVVIGLGGSGTNDGGAGLLAALGATSEPAGALTRGPDGLAELTSVDLGPALERLAGVELVAASDVDNPLLGLRGASNVFGAQKGLVDEDARLAADAALSRLAEAVERKTAEAAGAGAAGGLGYALLVLGGRREPGFATVASAVGLSDLVTASDLVITGEGKLDWQSMNGKVPVGVAGVANAALRPCIALAGAVQVGNRELRANGIEAAYSLVDIVGEEQAFAQPAQSLAAVAARVAKTWGRAR
ncbi:glycerate kinase family protein [Phytoactinopolyspora halotolerans]|uniref:Glycerate kinase n=1 Tax=Phytoactinopolyspora halotolerans TaxID=1981512 RepID=A0A6L9S9M0_9ACTN|nr:glycerate kinase [Phytoactinopolyspora halotolerans]NEE01777.1 glycerate kinase [Phytoactinopolyspora halotolerans]